VKKFFLLFLFLVKAVVPAQPDNLQQWYQYYNAALFNHELPDKIEIDHQLHDDSNMAITECGNVSKICRIDMNPDFEHGYRIRRETLLHEMCHVDVFALNGAELEEHGPRWQRCMHRVADENGFEDLW
jgi:predicted SprT family Zn-dependent metalloprotease